MHYRRIGSSALELSELSYGSWITFGTSLDIKKAQDCIACAYEHGVNFFDSAEVYLNGEAERLLGQIFKTLSYPRDSYCLSSKVLYGTADNHNPASIQRPTQRGLSRKHIVDACEQALERYQTDYLDIYLCHRPDPAMNLEEIAVSMDMLIRQGKVLYWGTSEFAAQDIQTLIDFCKANSLIPPQLEQAQYNLFHRARVEQEYQSLYEQGLGLTTWSPLASGVLAGRYDNGIEAGTRLSTPGFEWMRDFVFANRQDPMLDTARRFKTIADDLNITRSQLALCWCLQNKQVSSVILGASSVEQLEENLEACDKQKLLTDQMNELLFNLGNG